MLGCACLDLAYVYSCQSSCVLVGQMAPFSVTMKNFFTLLTTFVDSRVTQTSFATSTLFTDARPTLFYIPLVTISFSLLRWQC